MRKAFGLCLREFDSLRRVGRGLYIVILLSVI